MARESTISFEQVSLVAESIKAAGGKPTTRNIREKLGRGSMATILKLLQKWQGEQAQENTTFDNSLDTNIARTINSHISSRMQESAAEATMRLSDLQAETDTLISENESQAAELENQSIELLTWKDKYAELAGRTKQIEAGVAGIAAELKEERLAAENARRELAKCEIRLESALRNASELENVRAELRQAMTLTSQLHETAAVASAKLESETYLRKNVEDQLLALRQHEKQLKRS